MATTVSASFKQATGGGESEAEGILLNRLRLLNLPPFEPQVMLKEETGREYRWDVGWRQYRVLCDLQGGVVYKQKDMHKSGAHTRGKRYEEDCVKSALAQIAGYISLAVTPAQVQSGVAGMLIIEALKSRGWTPDPNRLSDLPRARP